MAIVIKEANDELGTEEKMIALKILLVIYLHDKRYLEALSDIEELLSDLEMESHKEYLLLRQKEVMNNLLSSSKSAFIHSFFQFFQNR